MAESKSEILQGTLDLEVLKALTAMGRLPGYGIARRIEQISEQALAKARFMRRWFVGNNGAGSPTHGVRRKTTARQSSAASQKWAASSSPKRRRPEIGVIGRALQIAEGS